MPRYLAIAVMGSLLLSVSQCDCSGEVVPGGGGDGGGGIGVLGDGSVQLGDGAVVPVDGGYDLGDGSMALPDGNVVPIPDGGVPGVDGGGSGTDGGGPGTDAWTPAVDSGPSLAVCDDTPEGVGGCQCSDGIDQPCDGYPEGNGFIDEYDIFCAGPYDDDECGWSTGIPGDNESNAHGDSECFFDGNSGPGNDDDCYLLVPPGCDCYGCCEFDVNGDGIREVVRLGGSCERFEPANSPQAGALGGACLAGDACDEGLFCTTDAEGGSFCGPCEPCENFGGTECDEETGEGCCWNECDPEAGEICFGDDPPPPVVDQPDAGGLPDGSVDLGDGATQLPDGGIVATPDGAYCSEEHPELCPEAGIPDGSVDLGDGATQLPDGAIVPTPDAGGGESDAGGGESDAGGGESDAGGLPPDDRCDGFPYCGTEGPCPSGMICYFACCMPLPG